MINKKSNTYIYINVYTAYHDYRIQYSSFFFFKWSRSVCVCFFFINYQIANEINDFKNALQL